MKRLILRSLLLMTAIGYFFAAIHTHEHHSHTTVHAHFTPHHTAAHHGDTSPQNEEDHECPICTVQSLAVPFVPTFDTALQILPLQANAILSSTIFTYDRLITTSLSARAPPLL